MPVILYYYIPIGYIIRRILSMYIIRHGTFQGHMVNIRGELNRRISRYTNGFESFCAFVIDFRAVITNIAVDQ